MNNHVAANAVHGTGRYQGQAATFLVAARADGATLWSVRTADGRIQTEWADQSGAEGMSWSSGIRYPLELEDRERHVRVARAIAGPERPAGGDLTMPTTGGPLRLALDRDDVFTLSVGGHLDWEFSVDRRGAIGDWPALRDSVVSSVSPAGAEWRSAAPGALTARRVAASGYLLAQVAVNGVEGWFIVDSGAGEMVLLPEFAGRAGGKAVGTVALTSFAGVEQATVVQLDTVDLGPLRLLNNTATITQALAELPAMIGDSVDGIIGAHLFGRACVTLDLKLGDVTIAPSAPARDRWLPLTIMNLHGLIEAELEGRSSLLRIDTGAMMGLFIHHDGVRRLGLLEGREVTPLPGGFGPFEMCLGKIDYVSVAGIRVDQVDACFVSGGADVLADVHTAGVLGIPVLRELGELTLDLPGRRLAVRPRG